MRHTLEAELAWLRSSALPQAGCVAPTAPASLPELPEQARADGDRLRRILREFEQSEPIRWAKQPGRTRDELHRKFDPVPPLPAAQPPPAPKARESAFPRAQPAQAPPAQAPPAQAPPAQAPPAQAPPAQAPPAQAPPATAPRHPLPQWPQQRQVGERAAPPQHGGLSPQRGASQAPQGLHPAAAAGCGGMGAGWGGASTSPACACGAAPGHAAPSHAAAPGAAASWGASAAPGFTPQMKEGLLEYARVFGRRRFHTHSA